MLAKLNSNKKKILEKSQEFFASSSLATIKIGCELEFFLLPKNRQESVKFAEELAEKLPKNFPLIYQVLEEKGEGQIELKTTFTADLAQLCGQLENARIFIENLAKEKNSIASFAAQPFEDDCGNALQFNISLHDESGKNLFKSDKIFLQKIAAKLLFYTNQMMVFLAPQEDDYRRFSFDLNRNLFKQGKFGAPVNLSFGGDNRTCAIRTINTENSCRLEYRPACALADPWLCISAILLAISLEEEVKIPDVVQIYGNAFDEQYQLPTLCQNLTQATEAFFSAENLLQKKITNFFS